MDRPPQRRIVQSPQVTLREILEFQLDMIQAVAVMRPLTRDEMQRLELLLKIYDKMPPEQQTSVNGITITVKAPTKKELENLIKIAEKN